MSSIQVRFVSISTPNETTVPISVPLTLGRYGLSEVLNHMLHNNIHKPYDFILNNYFLTTSLKTFINRYKLSIEQCLTLQYVESTPPPKEQTSLQHPDWISSITNDINPHIIVTGCYDGTIRYWDLNSPNKPINSIALHQSAIKDIKKLNNFIVTASKDQSIRILKEHTETVAIGKVHSNSVECLATNEKTNQIISGSWDKTLMLWRYTKDDTNEHSSKKRKQNNNNNNNNNNNSEIYDLEPQAIWDEHKGCVSAVCWPDSLAIYSGSWDHSIKLWDATCGIVRSTWLGECLISDIDFSLRHNLIATAHNDSIARLWDPRLKAGEVLKMTLKSHQSWITSINWCPHTANMFVTTSHDGTLKIWDIRSRVPLHSVKPKDNGKLLTSLWYQKDKVLTGGQSCQLTVHQIMNE